MGTAYYIVKILTTTLMVIAVSELAKKSTIFGGIMASIPLISVIAMFWLYFDTKETEQVAKLSADVFWLVIPSLVLFLALPWLLRKGINFYASMGISMGLTVMAYYVTVLLMKKNGQ